MKIATKLQRVLNNAVDTLLAELGPGGFWEGSLSASALSTAVACVALSQPGQTADKLLVDRGLTWLRKTILPDGSWGDTPESPGNISTTLLCRCALLTDRQAYAEPLRACEAWLERETGSLEPETIARVIRQTYGNDKTFSVPILSTAALTGTCPWERVPALPVELSVMPQRLFQWINMPVVSYALPALISMGILRHRKSPSRNPLIRMLRSGCESSALKVLQRIQPESGGFLEAVPLTGFVLMSLTAAGHADHPSAVRAARFLQHSVRKDGSWAIDSNLATWVTTLSVKALCAADSPDAHLSANQRTVLRDWLHSQQFRDVHPYTNAAPGGWAWTDLPGGVPDADDTAGALLALRHLNSSPQPAGENIIAGLKWLTGLQNADGGIPTFCRGRTGLAFDKSCPDITAHALCAVSAWKEYLSSPMKEESDAFIARCLNYLISDQQTDGSWNPLWFGNQHTPGKENPVYGTSRVLTALSDANHPRTAALHQKGAAWLISQQQSSGGWGGSKESPATIEETALALTALARFEHTPENCLDRALTWLISETRECTTFAPSPIGLYFASLWYWERLYPIIFTIEALGTLSARTGGSS